jgi:integrase
LVASDPALIAKGPPPDEEGEIEPYEVEEIRKLLEVAVKRRNSARWAAALALGLRQGEALGLQWPDIDLDSGTMRVRRGRLSRNTSTAAKTRAAASPATVPSAASLGRRPAA